MASQWHEAAIARSWDQVVGDYKAFHDVRARGGSLDDLPAHLQRTRQQTRPDAKPETSRPSAEHGCDATAQTGGSRATAAGGVHEGAAPETGAGTRDSPAPVTTAPDTRSGADVGEAEAGRADGQLPANQPSIMEPQTVMGTVGDDNLKKLLMSWYYAGYYTGLHEGQQQQQRQQQQEQQPAKDRPSPAQP